jgi:hypothetical protein
MMMRNAIIRPPLVLWASGATENPPKFDLLLPNEEDNATVVLQILDADPAGEKYQILFEYAKLISAMVRASGDVEVPIKPVPEGVTLFARSRIERNGTCSDWSNTPSMTLASVSA